ncbi:hypothetical protein Mapa_003528 [Marchantia paleacea]|nr:hypothetical protein Mapa_003528 [Marchantia paleacea]
MTGGHCRSRIVLIVAFALSVLCVVADSDDNKITKPCQDTTVKKYDGFTFGLVIAKNESFFTKGKNPVQLSPCDKRLTNLNSGQVAVFRPKVDEISLLIINSSSVNPQNFGGNAVVFAGSKFAAVSAPVFLANNTYRVTSLSLVLNFEKGRLMQILWKNDKCKSCSGSNTTFVCLKGGQCAVKSSRCKEAGGKVDCSLSIQTAFSGTDKYDDVLNTWYQVDKLQQYSLYALYSNLKSTLSSQFNLFF